MLKKIILLLLICSISTPSYSDYIITRTAGQTYVATEYKRKGNKCWIKPLGSGIMGMTPCNKIAKVVEVSTEEAKNYHKQKVIKGRENVKEATECHETFAECIQDDYPNSLIMLKSIDHATCGWFVYGGDWPDKTWIRKPNKEEAEILAKCHNGQKEYCSDGSWGRRQNMLKAKVRDKLDKHNLECRVEWGMCLDKLGMEPGRFIGGSTRLKELMDSIEYK